MLCVGMGKVEQIRCDGAGIKVSREHHPEMPSLGATIYFTSEVILSTEDVRVHFE
jgi:hypothetical protein